MSDYVTISNTFSGSGIEFDMGGGLPDLEEVAGQIRTPV